MKKLSIKNIIEFRTKSDKAKRNFVTALKIDKVKVDSKSGGDYWVSCLSAISNGFKLNDLASINQKKNELEKKYGEVKYKKTKDMYKRNIDILSNFEGFDFKKWRPAKKIEFLKKHKDDSILTIKGLQVQVIPHHVFKFQKDNNEEIGAIWFIAKLDGFKKDELGIFSDVLYRYLKTHFSKKYILNPKYCIAVDVFNNIDVNYSQLEKAEVLSVLNSTLDEIKKLI